LPQYISLTPSFTLVVFTHTKIPKATIKYCSYKPRDGQCQGCILV